MWLDFTESFCGMKDLEKPWARSGCLQSVPGLRFVGALSVGFVMIVPRVTLPLSCS